MFSNFQHLLPNSHLCSRHPCSDCHCGSGAFLEKNSKGAVLELQAMKPPEGHFYLLSKQHLNMAAVCVYSETFYCNPHTKMSWSWTEAAVFLSSHLFIIPGYCLNASMYKNNPTKCIHTLEVFVTFHSQPYLFETP